MKGLFLNYRYAFLFDSDIQRDCNTNTRCSIESHRSNKTTPTNVQLAIQIGNFMYERCLQERRVEGILSIVYNSTAHEYPTPDNTIYDVRIFPKYGKKNRNRKINKLTQATLNLSLTVESREKVQSPGSCCSWWSSRGVCCCNNYPSGCCKDFAEYSRDRLYAWHVRSYKTGLLFN